MGIKLIANDVVAPWHTKVVPPVTRGLEGWFNFDTDATRFNFNRAIGKADAVIVGAPVAYPTHGRFQGGVNYLQTSIEDTDELTLIVVGKAVTAPTAATDGAFYVGNYTGNSKTPGYVGNAYGASLYHQTATTLTGGAARDNGSGIATSAQTTLAGTPTTWGIRAMRTKSGVPTVVDNKTQGTQASGSSVLNRILADSKMRIGGATSSFAGEVDISCVAVYSTYLTNAELEAVVGTMRTRMARLGIAV